MPLDNPVNVGYVGLQALETDEPLVTPGGRLSLSSSNAVADVSTASTIYYLPYNHSILPLFDNNAQRWKYLKIPDAGFVAATGLLPSYTYDIYAFYNPSTGSLGLGTQAWSSATSRLISLIRRGLPVLDYGASVSDRYCVLLGTVRTTGTGTDGRMQDNTTQRLVWNAHNRVNKRISRVESTASWTYNGTAWRQWNNSAANRLEVVDGFGTGLLDLVGQWRAAPPSGIYATFAYGVDTTATATDNYAAIPYSGGFLNSITTRFCRAVGAGYHYVQALEAVSGTGTVTFYGEGVQGMQGRWEC